MILFAKSVYVYQKNILSVIERLSFQSISFIVFYQINKLYP